MTFWRLGDFKQVAYKKVSAPEKKKTNKKTQKSKKDKTNKNKNKNHSSYSFHPRPLYISNICDVECQKANWGFNFHKKTWNKQKNHWGSYICISFLQKFVYLHSLSLWNVAKLVSSVYGFDKSISNRGYSNVSGPIIKILLGRKIPRHTWIKTYIILANYLRYLLINSFLFSTMCTIAWSLETFAKYLQ